MQDILILFLRLKLYVSNAECVLQEKCTLRNEIQSQRLPHYYVSALKGFVKECSHGGQGYSDCKCCKYIQNNH